LSGLAEAQMAGPVFSQHHQVAVCTWLLHPGFREAADVARKVLTENSFNNVADPVKFRQVCALL
jgi:hypothetical protein